MRTTVNTLNALLREINVAKDMPLKPYTRTDGKLKANVGNYHLSQAYGGVCVHRMANEHGGCTTPIWHGHIPKREAESMIRAYMRGMEQSH